MKALKLPSVFRSKAGRSSVGGADAILSPKNEISGSSLEMEGDGRELIIIIFYNIFMIFYSICITFYRIFIIF